MTSLFSKASYVCLFAVAFFNVSHAQKLPKGKPFIALNDQIIEVKGSLSTLQEQMDLIVEEVETMNERINANESAITDLGVQNATLIELMNQNQTNVESINQQISSLELRNAELQEQLNAGSDNTDEILAQIDSNRNLINTLQATLLNTQDDIVDLRAI